MPQLDIVISSTGVSSNDFNKPANGGSSAQTSIIENQTFGMNGGQLIYQSMYAQQLMGATISTAKSWLNFAKSQYGDFTGDYIGQAKIDNAFAIANTCISVGSQIVGGAINGAMMGGGYGAVAGAVVGAVVSIGSLASTQLQYQITFNRQMARTNAQASLNASRIGAILIDGNRG